MQIAECAISMEIKLYSRRLLDINETLHLDFVSLSLFRSKEPLFSLFSETLISRAWSSAAFSLVGALLAFLTAVIPRSFGIWAHTLSIFARCYSRIHKRGQREKERERPSLLLCTCTLGQHQNSVWLTCVVKKIVHWCLAVLVEMGKHARDQ